MNENGVFIDEELEIKYNKYVNKKIKQGKVPRDRLDWKETVDWYQNSPIHRGNKFNHNAKFTQTDLLHEVHLENGKRLDSYNYEDGLIISRKATDLDKISEETYRQYLAEIEKKYSVGTKIQSNKYHKYKGKELQGKYVLEIPLSNKDLPNISHFEEIAKEYNVTLQYFKE